MGGQFISSERRIPFDVTLGRTPSFDANDNPSSANMGRNSSQYQSAPTTAQNAPPDAWANYLYGAQTPNQPRVSTPQYQGLNYRSSLDSKAVLNLEEFSGDRRVPRVE